MLALRSFQAWCKLVDHGRGCEPIQKALATAADGGAHFRATFGAATAARDAPSRSPGRQLQGIEGCTGSPSTILAEVLRRPAAQLAAAATGSPAPAVRSALRET